MSKKHPKVFQYGKTIDMSDLEADPWIMFQKRYLKINFFNKKLIFVNFQTLWFNLHNFLYNYSNNNSNYFME